MSLRARKWIAAVVALKFALGVGTLFAGRADAETPPPTPSLEAPPQAEAGPVEAEETLDAAAAEKAPLDCDLGEAVRRETELQARSDELRERERRLGRMEANLETLRKETEAQVKRLEALRAEIEGVERSKEEAASRSLAKIYGAMKAKEAAPLVARLEGEVVRRMFAQMKEKQVAAILAELPEKVAVDLTAGLARGAEPAAPPSP